MDAFYASVEQRDDPNLRGKPVVVAWLGSRSVVCAASYEARKFGVRSAMPAITAQRLCPSAVFIAPDFTRYRAVSRAVREIFARHTALIEPLSLDEAYLDLTETTHTGLEAATEIRTAIREELSLTASAGVASSKFLAKIASDWRKPDGLFEIRSEEAEAFLRPLPVGKVPGVGKVTEEKLAGLQITTVGDLRDMGLTELERVFGRTGRRVFELACGVDDPQVVPDRPTKSISAEDTFSLDLLLPETTSTLIRIAEKVWEIAKTEPRKARTVVLKLKTSDFKIITRSHTPENPPSSQEELVALALLLQARVGLDPSTRFRLVGVGLSDFIDPPAQPAQPSLF